MLFLMLVLVFVSMLGYFELFTRRLRIPSVYIPAFTVSSFSLLLLITGCCGNLDVLCYLFFYSGLGLSAFFIGWGIWKKDLFSSSLCCGFHKEFLFLLAITFFCAMRICDSPKEFFNGDSYTAWYGHFFYLVRNNKWSDIGYDGYYSSFCSRYTMITHSFTYYFCRMLNTYNSPPYLASNVVISIFCGFPLFRSIRWRRFPYFSGFLVASVLFFYLFNARVYADMNVFSFKTQPIAVLCVVSLFYIGIKSSNRVQLIDLLKFFTGFLVLFLMLFSARLITQIVSDGVLVCNIAWLVMIFFELHHVKSSLFYTYVGVVIPVLIFTSLIKPGEIMYGILLPLCFLLASLTEWLIHNRFRVKKAFCKKTMFRVGCYFLLMLAPVISYKIWGLYCDHNQFRIQHTAKTAGESWEMVKRHISTGLNEKEKKDYPSLYLAHIRWSPWRIPGTRNTALYDFIEKCSKYVDQNLSCGLIINSRSGILSVFLLTYIVLGTMLLCVLFSPRRRYLYHGIQSFYIILTVALIYFIHLYYGPFYLALPSNFRYFAPAFCIFLVAGVYYAFSSLSLCFRKNNWRILGIIPLILFAVTFGLMPWINANNLRITEAISVWPFVHSDECLNRPLIYARQNPEGYLAFDLCVFFPEIKNKIRIITKSKHLKENEDYILCVGETINFELSAELKDLSGPGIYIVNYYPEEKALKPKSKICDAAGLQELSKKYPLKDIKNWKLDFHDNP